MPIMTAAKCEAKMIYNCHRLPGFVVQAGDELKAEHCQHESYPWQIHFSTCCEQWSWSSLSEKFQIDLARQVNEKDLDLRIFNETICVNNRFCWFFVLLWAKIKKKCFIFAEKKFEFFSFKLLTSSSYYGKFKFSPNVYIHQMLLWFRMLMSI